MQPFIKHTGLVAPMDRVNVDTDQMVPKQFCKLLTREGYGRVLFYDWRYLPGEKPNPDFILNKPRYRGASVLLARANFGCGSSREHAPWAILDYGFHVVLAPSYADIFYNNCFKNGILPATLTDAQMDDLFARVERNEGYRLTADLETQTITDELGLKLSFAIDPFRKKYLLKGLDDIGLTLEHNAEIGAYENGHHPQAVMYDPAHVDVKIFTQK
jgi:3-isopropylmalate/(R)-2-methylmalate dehydratase small subunit